MPSASRARVHGPFEEAHRTDDGPGQDHERRDDRQRAKKDPEPTA